MKYTIESGQPARDARVMVQGQEVIVVDRWVSEPAVCVSRPGDLSGDWVGRWVRSDECEPVGENATARCEDPAIGDEELAFLALLIADEDSLDNVRAWVDQQHECSDGGDLDHYASLATLGACPFCGCEER